MRIALQKQHLILALGGKRAEEVCREIIHRTDTQRVPVVLTEVSNKEVDLLMKVAKEHNDALYRRMALWRDLRKEPDGFKIERSIQLEAALIEYVRRSPNRIIFHNAEDMQMLPYYVQTVQWHPAVRRKGYNGRVFIDPAYVRMSMIGFKDEAQATMHLRWNDTELFGNLTVSQLLEKDDCFLQNEESYAKYLLELARYHELLKATGQQFDGRGLAHGDRETEGWHGRMTTTKGLVSLTRDHKPSRLVIDIAGDANEDEENDDNRDSVDKGVVSGTFWAKYDKIEGVIPVKKKKETINEYEEGDTDEDPKEPEENEEGVILPVHCYIQVFDFERDAFVTCHVNCLTPYKFDTDIQRKLILEEQTKHLVHVLIESSRNMMEDIIKGKTGGVIVMSTGEPGTGKTLTAEVFAEQMEIPIYAVQCSQLGTTSDELEKTLILVLKRAMRWGALMLLDEADVYVRIRGDDIEQNAIVGVFLRVLEHYRGIMFMTSNRATSIDDAILSRCMAHIRYELPNEERLALIWEVLSENYRIDLVPKEFKELASTYPGISGRNVKTLIKLATAVANHKKEYKKGEALKLIHSVAPYVDFPASTAELRKKGR